MADINLKTDVLHTFEQVQEVFFSYITDPADRAIIQKAYDFADSKHTGILRKSGEPYIHHLIEVAYILARLQAGPMTIASGLLHDVVEDTDVTIEEIRTAFNDDVAMIVESLTKIQQLKLSHRENADKHAEDHRKIFIGMARDIRVIIIKLADRLHNMRTLDALPKHRQIALSRETLEIFAPIAHRLGMFQIKSELEDICLKYLEPDKYVQVTNLLESKNKFRQKSLDDIKKRIADIIFNDHIPFEMQSRVKSIYSIYKKIYNLGKNFDEIYDILAIRIVTDTVLHCYEILGLVHATYTPIPGRFKDYIAMPKPNLYQSLHTTIVSGDGQIYEVQIRTKEMDEIAETGVAAHWRYKEGRNYNAKDEQKEIEEKLYWFRDFINIADDDNEDAKEVMDNLSKDIFESFVYIFTPMGKVIDLPKGSTPLDFAYRIHTGVGDTAVGAIVNGTLVPLNTILKTGDVVEIKTNPNSPGPNEGWLKIVRTSSAKNHIRKVLLKKNNELMREDKIEKGRTSCLDSFKDRGFSEKEMMDLIDTPKVLEYFHFDTLDDLFIGICNRNPQPSALIDFLNIKKKFVLNLSKKTADLSRVPVIVPHAGKVAVTLGQCCTPIPGDDIVGFITKGKGITVHRMNCPNIRTETQRLTDVHWNENLDIDTYPVDLALDCGDRPNLLVDVMNSFSSNKVPVTAINAKLHTQTAQTTITATILVSDAKRLNDIINILQNITGVYQIHRLIH